MLYSRNFHELTDSEIEDIRKAEEFRASKKRLEFTGTDLMKYHDLLPEAYYYNSSLFPNHYLNSSFNEKMRSQLQELAEIIDDPSSNEMDILTYINGRQAYFTLEALFIRFYTGNHGKYLFKEFPLPPDYRADYLLVGRNSMGHEFIFVELEHPNKNITIKDGAFGKAIRDGLGQIEEWDSWLDRNFNSILSVFKKAKNSNRDLPNEFYELDKSRIHYLLIAGKRIHFNEKTYRLRRKYLKQKIHIYHYNNFLDDVKTLLDVLERYDKRE